MQLRFTIIALFSWVISTATYGQIGKIGLPFSEYYSSKEYKGGIQNMEITQGLDGLIYVANNFGLLTFDGTEWTIYNSRRGKKCRYILIGENGKVYTAGQGDFGYYGLNSVGQYQYTSLSDSLPKNYQNYDETWRIYKKDGNLVFCTFDYLFYYNNQFQLVDVKIAPKRVDSYFFINNSIITNQDGTGLLQLREDTFSLLPGGAFFSDKKVSAILSLNKTQLLITTQKNGIFQLSNGQVSVWNEANQAKFQKASVNIAIRLSSGEIAIGTLNDGLIITDRHGNEKLALTKGHGLENRTVLSLFEDSQNNLWVGHNNGISFIELNNPFSLINEQFGLPGTGYDAILSDNELILGTNNGVFSSAINANKTAPQRIINSLGQVYAIDKVYNKILTGQHGGSFSIENEEAQLISDEPGSWTFIPLQNHPGYILQGNYTGLSLLKKEDGQINFIRKIKGFTESSRVIEQADNGDIWMTHGYKGVFKFRLNDALDSVSVKFYDQESGLPSKFLINVWRINNQLIFTTERGIYVYKQALDRFVRFTDFDEYLGKDSQIISLAEDAVGNIYYVTKDEIGLLERNGNNLYSKHTSVFNRIDLLLNDDLQKIIALEANQILFAAKEGFIHFNNTDKLRQKSTTKTLIKKVTLTQNVDSTISFGKYLIDNKISYAQPTESIHELPFDLNAIRFSFTAPFMEANEKTRYQYWLENSEEKGFSDWTNKTEKEYTNLSDASYIFHVRAKNVYGDITDTSIYKFKISPPWYRNSFAYIVYFFFSMGVISVVFLLFEKRYKKQTKIINEQKEQEINRIDTELKTSEELIDKLKNDQLKAQIDIQNKELATSTMQIINKNEFINSVKGNLN
ncbi:MAG: ligand-binding sensor domain-containing protein, partial [Psychroserpens sp.]